MRADALQWQRICSLSDVEPGAMLRVEVPGGPAIVVFNIDGAVSTLLDRCSHGEFPLSDGYLDGDRVECALHGAYFCARSGKNLTPPATEPVAAYANRIESDGGIWVDFGST